MSLASRLIGVVLSLVGGWAMGDAQGIETISNEVSKICLNAGINMPFIGAIMGAYVGELIHQELTVNYGSYWVFGILLAIGGFVLIGRGDRKPRNPKDREPLLTEPLYGLERT